MKPHCLKVKSQRKKNLPSGVFEQCVICYVAHSQVTKLMIVVELLLGEIPERAQFKQPDMKRSLAPYFILTQGEFWIQPRDLKVAEIAQNVPFGGQLKIASKLGWSDISWNVLFSSSLLFDCIYYAFFGYCAINRSFAGRLLRTLARQSSIGVPLRLCRGSLDYKHWENSTYLQCVIFQLGGGLGALFGGSELARTPRGDGTELSLFQTLSLFRSRWEGRGGLRRSVYCRWAFYPHIFAIHFVKLLGSG